MKQKDILLIVVVVLITGIVSYFVSNLLFASPKDRQTKVEVVDVIDADFPAPDTKYFNKDSVNPTQLIQIGDSTNPQPFTSSTQ